MSTNNVISNRKNQAAHLSHSLFYLHMGWQIMRRHVPHQCRVTFCGNNKDTVRC